MYVLDISYLKLYFKIMCIKMKIVKRTQWHNMPVFDIPVKLNFQDHIQQNEKRKVKIIKLRNY